MGILYYASYYILFVSVLSCRCHSIVDVKKSLVWGPGLKTQAVLPARYFFIQAVDTEGKNVSDSLGEKAFAVNIFLNNGERIRVWTQIMDRKDGSYVVRYKMFSTAEDLMIDILYGGRHVASSPYTLKGTVYNEKCDCPQPKLSQWLKDMECPASYKQIKLDLAIFKQIDVDVVEQEAVSRFNQKGRHSLCHYVIKDNKIYRKTHGNIVDFKMFMDAILLSLTRKNSNIKLKSWFLLPDINQSVMVKSLDATHLGFSPFQTGVYQVKLPDVEFFVNLGDWPLETRTVSENPIPIFSWCGSDKTQDIIMPTYDITESTLETMGRVSLDMISVQGNTGPRWENKSSMAFWRGRDSRQERLNLVKLSRKNPDILDAKLTNMFFFKHEEELGDVVKAVSFFDFFEHKYQINIDGTVAAYRLPYLLAGDSVVLKQDSQYYEFFYKQLKPYEHFIPIKADISDVLNQTKWAMEHDEEAKKIAQNAQQFARDHLMGPDVFCYHVILFKEYAKRLSKPAYVRPDMEEVNQPVTSSEAECTCKRSKASVKKTKPKKVDDEL